MNKKYRIYQEQDFHIAVKDNNVFIIISSYCGQPNSPEIVYDGKEHAILYRNTTTSVLLDYINPSIRENLINSNFVTVIETQKNNNELTKIIDYKAKLKIVKKLPENIEIITPEKLIQKIKNDEINHRFE